MARCCTKSALLFADRGRGHSQGGVMIAIRTAFSLAMVLIALEAGAQTPVQSFNDLPSVLRPRQRVIVRDDTGRTSRGTVTSLARDRLELEWRTWRFQRREQVFPEASVRSIAIIDSTWNGQLIGLGVGVLGAWAMNAQCNDDSCIASALAGVALLPAAGLFVGQAIDHSMNRVIYVSRRNPNVTLGPFLTPIAGGVAARVRF